ncbi:acid type B receptor subunit 2 [Seminavis robusta]|uniref:Acid type B receptor subunit 2 n=1 Tax=Seminavis robusta TaxID=568900 RepID=A0A9N8ECJ1_9STRA|nr:acid type B receptor subunit 2 [Seminavis robusta]|eukprot:Sro923_g220670.1 acid type B receptor subunit 2 (734) ;mRNA; r:3877-6078
MEIPSISGTSTSSQLDATLDTSPLFSRTVPATDGDALAAAVYLKSLNVTHVGCFYINDAWGFAYQADLQRQASKAGMKIISVPYLPTTDSAGQTYPDIEAAMEKLAQHDLRYYVLLMYSGHWKPVFRAAIQRGIMGMPGYTWFLADSNYFFNNELALDRETESDLAQGLNGMGVLNLGLEPHPSLTDAMQQFSSDTALQEEFYSKQAYPERFHNQSHFHQLVTDGYPGADLYFQANYHAVMALGLAACQTPGLFRGPDLDQTLRQLEFNGTSGMVRFHPITGTRLPTSVQYTMTSLVLSDEKSTETEIKLDHFLAATIRSSSTNDQMVVVPAAGNPFRYSDNTTIPPMALPPIAGEHLKVISSSAQVVAWIMASATIALALVFLGGTWCYKNRTVFRAAQPIFLAQLCVGIIIMVTSVYPMSYNGVPDPNGNAGADLACMITPWLFVVGYTIAISALMAKAWRLSKLILSGRGMKRITVHAQDVLLPFMLLMTLNVGILTAWTVVAPLTYQRVWLEDHIDFYGRRVESYAICQTEQQSTGRGDDDSSSSVSSSGPFLISLAVLNLGAVFVALYQCYVARALPTSFSESKYLTLSIASIFETLCIGAPFLFLVPTDTDPSAHFSIQSSLVCIIGTTILLLLFLPKFSERNQALGGAAASGPSGRAQTAMISNASLHSTRSYNNKSHRISGLNGLGNSRAVDRSGLDSGSVRGSAHSLFEDERYLPQGFMMIHRT